MKCEKCDKYFSRSAYIVHISEESCRPRPSSESDCEPYEKISGQVDENALFMVVDLNHQSSNNDLITTNVHESEDTEETEDDSDADPTWSPQDQDEDRPSLSKKLKRIDTLKRLSGVSPLTLMRRHHPCEAIVNSQKPENGIRKRLLYVEEDIAVKEPDYNLATTDSDLAETEDVEVDTAVEEPDYNLATKDSVLAETEDVEVDTAVEEPDYNLATADSDLAETEDVEVDTAEEEPGDNLATTDSDLAETEDVEVDTAVEEPGDNLATKDSVSAETEDISRLVEKNFKTKRNWCKYCNTLQTKLSRHMAAKHKDVEEVKQYMLAQNKDKKKQKKERRDICKSIVNNSNRIYNNMVINKTITGNPIPVRVSKTNKENADTTTHKFCSTCSGLFARRYFSKHKSHCISKNKNTTNEIPTDSVTFEPKLEQKFKLLHTKVLCKMNKDKLYKVIVNDHLILEFGRRFLKSHMDNHQRNYVAGKMRSVAELFIRMKQLDPTIISFKDCIQPDKFNTLCDAVQQWSQYDEQVGVCGIGSVARRLCKSLKVCSYILVSESIRSKTTSDEEQLKIKIGYEKFTSLMDNDWSLEVNSAGDKSLKMTKVLKSDKMPEDQDLITFFESMTSIIKKAITELLTTEQLYYYENLAKSTLAYLIAFNSRRPNEVAMATIKQYNNLQFSHETSDEQGHLAVFTVPATKNDVKVPVIVPQITQQAIQTLLRFRPILSVKGDLLFGKGDGTPYNGSHILNKFKSEMSLINPADFTANGIRHYWATKSQTKPEIKKHMPKFLGHTLATHQKFYELPSSDIHLNIIGPLLLQHTQSRQTTQSTSSQSKEISKATRTESTDISTFPSKPESNSSYDCEVQMEPSSSVRNYIPSSIDFGRDTKTSDGTQSTPPKMSFSDSSSVASTPSPLPINKRKRWITPEKKELFQNLPQTLLGLEPAGRGKIKEVWQKSKVIRKRHNLQMTRIEVSKYFTKKKRITTPEKEKFSIPDDCN